jgi:hypothetical protein
MQPKTYGDLDMLLVRFVLPVGTFIYAKMLPGFKLEVSLYNLWLDEHYFKAVARHPNDMCDVYRSFKEYLEANFIDINNEE